MLEPNAAISPLAHICTDTQSPELRDAEYETKASSSNTKASHDLSDSHIANARAARENEDMAHKDPHQRATVSQVSPPPIEPRTGEPPATESTDQKPPALSISQKLWNAAYDILKRDDENLLRSYMETLTKALGAEAEIASGADVIAELEDPTKRQMYMEKLVEQGRAKVAKASKRTKRVGDFAEAILWTKPVVNVVLQIPQAAPAALPWAGVCVGLEVSNHL
jgi:hypothetical protein